MKIDVIHVSAANTPYFSTVFHSVLSSVFSHFLKMLRMDLGQQSRFLNWRLRVLLAAGEGGFRAGRMRLA